MRYSINNRYSDVNTEGIITLRGQNVEILNVKPYGTRTNYRALENWLNHGIRFQQ
jgi:hypothetical protein